MGEEHAIRKSLAGRNAELLLGGQSLDEPRIEARTRIKKALRRKVPSREMTLGKN